MTLTKAKLLKDAKEESKEDLDKNKGSFHLLMQSFASDSDKNIKTDYENQEFAKEIYSTLEWEANNFDVINSYWQTFSWAMHFSFPEEYPKAKSGNVKIYKNHNYQYNIRSFPEKYIKEKDKIPEQVSKLIQENPDISEFAARCHCAANFCPCPDNFFNSAKGTSRAKDYLPLMIDLIQYCIDHNEPLLYNNNQKIEVDKLGKWKKWFIDNQEMYCLSGYYTIENNKLKGKPLFNNQSLEYPFPKNKEEVNECITNILKKIDSRANQILSAYENSI